MLTIEKLNAIREGTGATYQEICFASGIPISTVQKVLGGATKNPRMTTLQRLNDALCEIQRAREGQEADPAVLKEKKPAYGNSADGEAAAGAEGMGGSTAPDLRYSLHQQGQRLYTAEEREELPDSRRTELIDGVLYDMAAPSILHQLVCKLLCEQLDACIAQYGRECLALPAPVDVALDQDEYTRVQPDIVVVCHPELIREREIAGAPDMTVEITSPATAARDHWLKLQKYMSAGVREYWIVDPKAQQVLVYTRSTSSGNLTEDPTDYEAHTWKFTDRIPVGISGGECEIDMHTIQQTVRQVLSKSSES